MIEIILIKLVAAIVLVSVTVCVFLAISFWREEWRYGFSYDHPLWVIGALAFYVFLGVFVGVGLVVAAGALVAAIVSALMVLFGGVS